MTGYVRYVLIVEGIRLYGEPYKMEEKELAEKELAKLPFPCLILWEYQYRGTWYDEVEFENVLERECWY